MRKFILLFCVSSFLVFSSFTVEDKTAKFPYDLSVEAIDFFEKEYVKTITSSYLKEDIRIKFFDLFDEVSGVDAQFSEVNGYYYIVFGKIEGIPKIELLKVELEDIENETYSYIDFSKIDRSQEQEYCKNGMVNPRPWCPIDCIQYEEPGYCLGMICGVGRDCVPE